MMASAKLCHSDNFYFEARDDVCLLKTWNCLVLYQACNRRSSIQFNSTQLNVAMSANETIFLSHINLVKIRRCDHQKSD